jgi:hypothetical protein
MCGRYGRRADKQRIAEWMKTHNPLLAIPDSRFSFVVPLLESILGDEA